MRTLALGVVLVIGLVSCGDAVPGGFGGSISSGPMVRVQVFPDRPEPVEIAVVGQLRILSLPDRETLWEGELPRARIEFAAGTVSIAGESMPGPVRLVPVEGGGFGLRVPGADDTHQTVETAGKFDRFRGVLDLLPHDDGLRLVNELGVEEYLAGVVGREMGGGFTLEALKAQAIAARTFTLYHLRVGGALTLRESFPATSRFQAYGGMGVETPDVLRAVRETAGWVLTHDARLFQSYYHSSCGGVTASGRIFNERAIPPLRGVACDHCQGAPRSQWETDMPLWHVDVAVRQWAEAQGFRIGRVEKVQSAADVPGERATYLRIEHSQGTFEMRADRFRRLLNRDHPGGLRSTVFQMEVRRQGGSGAVAHFAGRGNGHGVGLCQSGAGRLGQGEDYRGVLSYYFPDSSLMKVY